MLSEFSSQLIAEFVGTFLFILTIPLANSGVGTLAPVPIGFMFSAMCFTFGYISGAHFNPAISFAVFLIDQLSLWKLVCYVFIQLLAAFFSALYATSLIGLGISVPEIGTGPSALLESFLCELVYTFVLASVVLHLCYSRQRSSDVYGFAMGFGIIATSFAIGGPMAGAFNPAVATGTQLVACLGYNCEPLYFCWVYWLAPLSGTFIASVLYQILDAHDTVACGGARARVVY